MSIALSPNILQKPSPRITGLPFSFIPLFFILLMVVLLLGACTTVPESKQENKQADKYQLQEGYFQQAKQFYLEQQYTQASRLFLALARQGHRESQYVIGYMYHYGYGMPRNEKESTRWIATAAARGHLKAQEALQLINTTHDLAILDDHATTQAN